MPASTTCTVTWNTSPSSSTTYDITDDTKTVETDGYVKIWGKLHGSQDSAHWIEITRAATKTIELS